MLFKVMIIDDEHIVRKGIATVINWTQYDCQVVAEASNGFDGMQLIEKHLPHIIITDISMPNTNGLDMIRKTKHLIPHAKIIVLTGFRDFDYLQDALQLGAMAYLLKPTKLNEINDLVQKAVTQLKYALKEREIHAQMELYFEQSKPLLIERYLKDALLHLSVVDPLWMTDLYSMGFQQGAYRVIRLSIDDDLSFREMRISKLGIIRAFKDTFSHHEEIYTIDLESDSLLMLLSESLNRQVSIPLHALLEGFQALTSTCFHVSVSLAIGRVIDDLNLLSQQAEACQLALSQRFYLDKALIISVDDISQTTWQPIGLLQPIATAILQAIKTGQDQPFFRNLQLLRDRLTTPCPFHAIEVSSFLVRLLYDIYNWAQVTPQLASTFKLSAFELHQRIENLQTSDALLEELHAFGRHMLNQTVSLQTDSNNAIVMDVKDYILKRYRESISLDDLAEVVHASTYYISRLFKRETGKNISEFILEVRLQEAINLMKNSDYKLYEIAERVGIPDPQYFSKVFKKQFGCSPKQYDTTKKTMFP